MIDILKLPILRQTKKSAIKTGNLLMFLTITSEGIVKNEISNACVFSMSPWFKNNHGEAENNAEKHGRITTKRYEFLISSY